MCYARRQRSSWARIKLSKKWLYTALYEQHILSFLELAYLSFLLLFRVFQSDFDEIPSHTRIFHPFVFKILLFNFQWPSSSRLLGQRLSNYTTFDFICQAFFESFLKNFRSACFSVESCAVFHTAWPLYNIKKQMSTPFWRYFTIFLRFFWAYCTNNRLLPYKSIPHRLRRSSLYTREPWKSVCFSAHAP